MKQQRAILAAVVVLIVAFTLSVASQNGYFTETKNSGIIVSASPGPTGAQTFSTETTFSTASCGSLSGVGPLIPGDIVMLTADVSGSAPCIVADFAGVIFDCDGHSVSSTGDAIEISATDVTVRNCRVNVAGGDGVQVDNTGDNFFIVNSNITAAAIGIRMQGTAANRIERGVVANVSFALDTSFDMFGQFAINTFFENNSINNNPSTSVVLASFNHSIFSNNSWPVDHDTSSTSAVVFSASGINLTFKNQKNMSMEVSCTTCHNSTFYNNTLRNNGLFIVGGENVSVVNNTWHSVGIQGQTSGGIEMSPSASTRGFISGNMIVNGSMMSIEVGSNSVAYNNLIENISGTAFVMTGQNSTAFNNTVRNLTGIVFKFANASTVVFKFNNTIENNTIVFVPKTVNTTLNLANLSTPNISESSVGVSFDEEANLTFVRNNQFNTSGGANMGSVYIKSNKRVAYLELLNNSFRSGLIAVLLTSASHSNITSNIFVSNDYRGIIIENGTNITVQRNLLNGSSTLFTPSFNEIGVMLLRTTNTSVITNDIRRYHTGVFVLNSLRNLVTDLNVTSGVYGILSVQSSSNNFTGLNVFSTVETGVKFLMTNSSIVNLSNVNATVTGFEFHKSLLNFLEFSNQTGASDFGLTFDMFSANNTANNNSLGTNPTDILFDMFSNNNNGAGNGAPTSTSENGAAGNVIT